MFTGTLRTRTETNVMRERKKRTKDKNTERKKQRRKTEGKNEGRERERRDLKRGEREPKGEERTFTTGLDKLPYGETSLVFGKTGSNRELADSGSTFSI
jgi:hypothetical protein